MEPWEPDEVNGAFEEFDPHWPWDFVFCIGLSIAIPVAAYFLFS